MERTVTISNRKPIWDWHYTPRTDDPYRVVTFGPGGLGSVAIWELSP
jgi:hypothetical protein